MTSHVAPLAGFFRGGYVSTRRCRFLDSSSDGLSAALAPPRRQQQGIRLAVVSEHFLVDLQCGATGFGVDDLAEALSLSLHRWDGL